MHLCGCFHRRSIREHAGPVAASAQRAGASDPHTYLVDVLQRISEHPDSHVTELTARMWKQHFAMPEEGMTCGVAILEEFCRYFIAHFQVAMLAEQISGSRRGRNMGGTLSITFDDVYLDNFRIRSVDPFLNDQAGRLSQHPAGGMLGSRDRVGAYDAFGDAREHQRLVGEH